MGVDIDADARDAARAELLLAGLPNCTLRQGDMYRLPFADAAFDTVVLDDVLTGATRPTAALLEARRLLSAAGRLLVLIDLGRDGARDAQQRLSEQSAAAGLRIAPPRLVPRAEPAWQLSVATVADTGTVAA